jgi:hypothetical protein
MPVPDFSPGEVLTAAAMDSIGLWLVKTQSISATPAQTVVVTNAFSADYDNYLITISGSSVSSQARIRMTINGSAGSTYRHGGWRSSYGAAVIDSEQANNATSWSICLADTGLFAASIQIFNPQKAAATFFTATSSGLGFSYYQSGVDTNSAASTDFTLDPDSTVTLANGVIRVYGYRN